MRLAGLGVNGEIFLVVESGSLSFSALSSMLADAGYAEPIELAAGQEYETHYSDGANVVQRPTPPPPPALVASVDALWIGLPPGALVTLSDPVTGPAGSDHASPTGELLLPAPTPGAWLLEVAETFPWLAATFTVEVAP